MALETMKKEVHSDDETEEIDLWQRLGWELKNTREEYSIVTLLFQRDTAIENYYELRSLQREVELIDNKIEELPMPPAPPSYTGFGFSFRSRRLEL